MQTKFIATTILVAASAVQAGQFKINNWCKDKVTIMQSVNGGPDTKIADLAGGNGQSIQSIPYTNNLGTSIKISRPGEPGVLQYEYTNAPGQLWWDISNLDGKGGGLVGTPFYKDNVKVSPTGAGVGQGTCVQLKCPANQVCKLAYNDPNQVATKSCPPNTGDMWLDLCQPDQGFNRRRELSDKHLRRHAVQLSK